MDYFLRSRDPDLSQRACKRLCQNHLVLINGKPGKPGQPLRKDDLVLVTQPLQSDIKPALYSQVRIVQAQNGLYAIKKPAGLHSVNLQGSGNSSLEDCLQLRWSTLWDNWNAELAAAQAIYPFEEAGAGQGFCAFSADPPVPPLPQLLNRLDQDTSGLVMAAGTPEARQRYLAAEETWQISKNYLALVRGTLEKPITVTNTLRSHNKTRMRAREDAEMNPLRHTHVTPLATMNLGQLPHDPENTPCTQTQPYTLVVARIAKGVRHQIRVHLAQAGYPIVGDTLYTATNTDGSQIGPDGLEDSAKPEQVVIDSGSTQLFLHHAYIALPGFSAALQPDWPEALWREHWQKVIAKPPVE